MDIKDLFEFSRKITLFSIYEDEELAELLQLAKLRSVRAGELVFDHGDPGDNFYIVYSGRIRVLHRNGENKECNLGVRVRGDHFGERALITHKPSNIVARAAEESILISIDDHSFHEHFISKPEISDYFSTFMSYTEIHQFLKTGTDFKTIPAKDLNALARKCTVQVYEEGETILRQGAEVNRFYLIKSGKVKVARRDSTGHEIIHLLFAGNFFGGKALIERTRCFADVTCLTNCQFYMLPREDFQEIVEGTSKLKKVIADKDTSYAVGDSSLFPYEPVTGKETPSHERKTAQDSRKETSKAKGNYTPNVSYLYRHAIQFPFIKQHDRMTCGTTCIMMIARYYGKHFSSGRLRDLAHVDLNGALLSNLASAAEQLGFLTRGMQLSYDVLMSVELPCIVHWEGDHFIVVYKIDKKSVWVADPQSGLKKFKKDYFLEKWNGITLTMEPTPKFEKQAEERSSLKKFLQFVLPYKVILFEIFIASLLLNLFGLAIPIFTQNVVDKVLIHHNVSMLNIMLIGMVIILVFRVLTMLIRQYLIIHTTMKIDLRILVFFYKHMLALPLSYFKVRKIGDFITRFGENMKIRNFLTNTALTMVLDTLLIVVYLSLMLYYSLPLTALVLLIIPLFVVLTASFTPVLKRLNMDSFSARVESDSQLIESLNGIDTIKTMNVEYPVRWKWENKFLKSLNIDFKLYNTGMYFHSLGDFIAALSSTLILWYGSYKVIQGAISVGELMAFTVLMGSVITPINRLIEAWEDIQETLVSVDRLNDVLNARTEFPEAANRTNGLSLENPKGEINCRNVYFRYKGKDDPYILSKINLSIRAGQKVAIVGRSGSGKTTLARLIARLYDVVEGKIMIDGHDIKNINLSSLRKMVGFVLQENFLFNGSIQENISIGDSEETMEKVINAAQLANAHDFISNLPMGYQTRVGESGLQLSSGQKQRIAIARALYSNPKIIIFDEATSFLDPESERAIQDNLREILKDRTAIIIAHRLSTVKCADIIITLDKGEIVEMGTHDELMEQRGFFHYLKQQQL